MKDQINQPTNAVTTPTTRPTASPPMPPVICSRIADPIPEATLAMTTTSSAWFVAAASFSTSSYREASNLAALIILSNRLISNPANPNETVKLVIICGRMESSPSSQTDGSSSQTLT